MRRASRWVRPGAGPGARSWKAGVDTALIAVFVVLVVNDLFISAGPLRSALTASTPAGRVGIVVAIAGLVGPLLWAWRHSLSSRVVLGGVMLVWAGQVLDALQIARPRDLTDAWWALQVTAPLCGLLFAVVPWRRALPVGFVLLGTYSLCRLTAATGPGHGWTSVVADVAVLADYSLVARLVVPSLRKLGSMADAAVARRAVVHSAAEAEDADARALRAAERLLHDEVIHCLRALSMPPQAMPEQLVQKLCAATQAHLSEASAMAVSVGVPSFHQQLADLAQQLPLDVTLHCHPDVDLPPEVAAAVTGAVGEALRNIHRHADTAHAKIVVADRGGEVCVTVSDHGAGFDTSGVRGMGITSSIIQQVAEIGGTTTIDSTPGRGTSVILRWPRSAGAEAEERCGLLDPGLNRTRIIVGTVVPTIIFPLVQLLLHHDEVTDPVIAAVTVLLNLAAVGWALVRCARRGMSGPTALALCALAVVTAWVGGRHISSAAHLDVAYFAAGAAAPGLALIAFLRPGTEALAACAAATTAVVLTIFHIEPSAAALTRGLPAVTASAFTVGFVLLARWILDKIATAINRDNVAIHTQVRAQARARARVRVSSARLQRVHDWVTPLLEGVAAGKIRIGDTTKQQARTLEAAVRDDIRFGAYLSEPLRIAIAHLRSAGGVVQILAEQELLAQDQQLISDLMIPLLAAADPPTSLVLTCGPGQQVSVLIRPPASQGQVRQITEITGASAVWGAGYTLLRTGGLSPVSLPAGTWRPTDVGVGSGP